MMLRKLDILSPKITLFYYGNRAHTSILGGILVLIMTFCCCGYSLYRIIALVNHKNVSTTFYKKNIWEAGRLDMNETSLFNFMQIYSTENGGEFPLFDKRYARVILSYVHSSFNESNLINEDHWVYDNCEKGIDDKYLNESLFINIENFTNGVCLKYYYNSINKKYYNKDDKNEKKNFVWPKLEHGINQKNNIFIHALALKCNNDSIITKVLGKCGSDIEIEKYIQKFFGFYFYFLDYEIDPTNFNNPSNKYFQVQSCGLGRQNYVGNYLHFNPLSVKSKKGFIFRNNKQLNLFNYDFNRKSTEANDDKQSILTRYLFLLQNSEQIYQRETEDVLDFISDMGGTIQFLYYLFFAINYIYNKYNLTINTNNLLFEIKGGFESNEQKNKLKTSFVSKYRKVFGNKLVNSPANFSKFYKGKIKFFPVNYMNYDIPNIKYLNINKPIILDGSQNQIDRTDNLLIYDTISNNKSLQNLNINKDNINCINNKINSKENNILDRYCNNISSANNIIITNNSTNNAKEKESYSSESNYFPNLKRISDKSSIEVYKKKLNFLQEDDYNDNAPKNQTNNPINVIKKSINKKIKSTYNHKSQNNIRLSDFKNQIITKESRKNSNINNLSFKQINNYKTSSNKNLNSSFENIKNESLIKGNFNLLQFIFGGCGKFKNEIFILENFRKKLLSEEHLYRTHINVYLFQKYFNLSESEKTDLIELYLNL